MTLVPRPTSGRVYETTRRVRLADADPSGRLRLDALNRLLQDVGTDDAADAGLDAALPWVARRSEVVAESWPLLGDRLHIATWCGGTGSRWAERRSSVTTESGAQVDVATLWVHVDDAGRPTRLPERFTELYGEAAGGRTVTTRLSLPEPPAGADRRSWPARAVDLDLFGHVNNAVAWAPLEEVGITPRHARLEWRGPLERHDALELVTAPVEDGTGVWLVVGDDVRVAGLVA